MFECIGGASYMWDAGNIWVLKLAYKRYTTFKTAKGGVQLWKYASIVLPRGMLWGCFRVSKQGTRVSYVSSCSKVPSKMRIENFSPPRLRQSTERPSANISLFSLFPRYREIEREGEALSREEQERKHIVSARFIHDGTLMSWSFHTAD